MVEPTARLLDLFDRYGAKLTIMADVAEILKFREYKEHFGRDDYHYDAIVAQLRDAIRRGHDVQLHLHCSYFNARFVDGRWQQDWSEYNFAGLSEERLNQVIRIGKDFLEEELRPGDPDYRCYVFRAANWAVSPSRYVVRALVNNGFEIDTSVFKYGRRHGLVSFDYTNAPSHLEPWLVDEEDICRRKENGTLLEVPIYCERRWLGAFLSSNRFYRLNQSRHHRLKSAQPQTNGAASNGNPAGQLFSKVAMPFRKHAWKADFNQCTGRQLIQSLHRASGHNGRTGELPFVLIGHSKLFTAANGRSVEPFLDDVRQRPAEYRFARFDRINHPALVRA
jgi:hypothetical protein